LYFLGLIFKHFAHLEKFFVLECCYRTGPAGSSNNKIFSCWFLDCSRSVLNSTVPEGGPAGTPTLKSI